MDFEGPDARRNFLIVAGGGLLGFSILVFVVISLITGAFSSGEGTKQQAQQPSSSSSAPSSSPAPSTPTTPEQDQPSGSGGGTDEDYTDIIVEIDKDELHLFTSETAKINATITPPNSGYDIVWSTSNPEVARVSDGVITAISEGTANITITVNKEFRATCVVYVEANKDRASSGDDSDSDSDATITPTKITLDKTNVSLVIGKSTTVKATVSPSDAEDKTVTWSSANKKIATVSDGKITAVSAGSTTITAKTSNGKTATVKVTVTKPIAATGIKLNAVSASIKVGQTYTVKATISPSNATNKTITWSSNNTAIATVSSSGVVKAKSSGFATITAKTHNGRTAEIIIIVKR